MSDEHEIYKRNRPQDFKDMIGQDESVKILEKKLATNTLPRALLLFGPSRCGKTTAARIIVNRLGCHEDFDFTEMNAADNRGIDDIRDIRSRINHHPVGKCRVWLIDECHKLTADAQTAFLKMLEDTPKTVYFILATTDPGKLIATVRKRCMPVEFKPLSPTDMMKLLTGVCKKEKLKIPGDVMEAIIEKAEGSAGESLVLLDKIKDLDDEEEQLNAIGKNEAATKAIDLCRYLINPKANFREAAKILKTIEEEPETIRRVMMGYMTSVLLNKCDARTAYVLDCFTRNFYDSGKAGLAIAVWQACNP
jgi:DNA polymerase III gamma/tau subunit